MFGAPNVTFSCKYCGVTVSSPDEIHMPHAHALRRAMPTCHTKDRMVDLSKFDFYRHLNIDRDYVERTVQASLAAHVA